MSAPGYQISRDPTAVIGSRTAAWIVDFLLYAVLVFGLLGPTPLSPLAEYSEVPDGMSMETACERVGDLDDVNSSSCLLIGDRVYFTDSSDAVIQFVGWLAYVGLIYIVWQGITGLTPGKLLFGLRTVGADGRPPGMLKALVRSVLWIVDGFPYCIPGLVGFITGLTSTGHRRVGDMAAKTFVVGKGDTGQPVMVPGLTTGTYGAPTVYGAAPGYAPPVPSSAPWGTPPAGPGAPGAPGAPGTPGAPAWGTPPAAAPQPPYPAPDARPAPPAAPSYGTPGETTPPVPSGGYASPSTPSEPSPPSAPSAPPAPSGGYAAPEASAFGESTDPADTDLAADVTTPPADEAPSAEPAAGPGEGAAETATGDAAAAAAGDSPDAEAESEAEATEPAAGEAPASPAPADDTSPTAPAEAPTPEATTPAATTAGATTDQTYSPQWDAARGAYIQWDPNRSRWLQWDDAAKEWKPI